MRKNKEKGRKKMELKHPIVSMFDFLKIPNGFTLEKRLQIQDSCIFAERRFSGLSVEDEMTLNSGFISIFVEGDTSLNGGQKSEDCSTETGVCEMKMKEEEDVVLDSDRQEPVLGIGKYSYRICEKKFGLKSSWKNHQVAPNTNGDIQCKTESPELKTNEPLYQCNLCPEQFEQEQLLNDHKNSHHTEKQFKCKECHKAFKDKSNFTKHVMIHTGEKPFSCSECGQQFRIKQHWRQHEMRHREEFLFDCDICGKLFLAKKMLQKHLKTHMEPHDLQVSIACELCGKQFTKRKYLTQHITRHSGVKQHKCLECGKEFYDKSNLNKHELIHTGEKPYTCEICSKTFRMKHQKDRHRGRFHKDVKAGGNADSPSRDQTEN
ncbi:hypothetical protein WMY93_014796 [Mugilogobius chulae]|uniref:C2H2-type domain-containing protein n=1 Tax=Mugilogobius chulae TaxID=88201 RepID=A0AAW0NVY3_9GOBI